MSTADDIQALTYEQWGVAWCKVVPLATPDGLFEPPTAFEEFLQAPSPNAAHAAAMAFLDDWLYWWTPESMMLGTLERGPWLVADRGTATERVRQLVERSKAQLAQRHEAAQQTLSHWLTAAGLPVDTPFAAIPPELAASHYLESFLHQSGLSEAGGPHIDFVRYDWLAERFLDDVFGAPEVHFVVTPEAVQMPGVIALSRQHIGLFWYVP